MPVTIQNSQNLAVQTRTLLLAARRALRSEGHFSAEVSILLTDDSTVHALNLQYRGQDKPTDVLSFAQRDSLEGALPIPAAPKRSGTDSRPAPELLGDVVVSVETASRQADWHGRNLDEELALLTVHGILHLLGYDDATDEGAEQMQQKERALGVRE